MTRRLLLMRHAKSDRSRDVPDHDRALSTRGRRDAVAAGGWLAAHAGPLDQVVCSPALRARRTWTLAAKAFDAPPPVRMEPRIYLASAEGLLEVVRETDPAVQSLLLVGHNPGIEDLALALAESGDAAARNAMRRKFPTCALAVLETSTEWAALSRAGAALVAFVIPRSS